MIDMKRFIRVAIIVVACINVYLASSCALTPIHARTIEEIRGAFNGDRVSFDLSFGVYEIKISN